MELKDELLERARGYDGLSRWERSELGRKLRRAGLSYGEIMDLIPVKKSTLATWCRDIKLTEEQVAAIRERTGQEPGIPRDTQRKRRAEIRVIQAQAAHDAERLIRDPFWTLGLALYWGEGSKTSRRLEMAHSEPEALRMFINWSRRFHDPAASFAGSMNLHYDNNEIAALQYWCSELGLDPTDFTKTFIKPEGTGHRKNHLATGVCRVTMRRSTDAFLRTMQWIAFVKDLDGL